MSKGKQNVKAEETTGTEPVVEVMENTTATPPAEEVKAPTGTKKEETVQISRSDFDKLISTVEKQAKDIDLLYKAADKNRMSKAMGDGGEVLIKKAKVSTWDNTGKFIIGWKLITDRCEVVLGRWVEEQTVNLILEDGETMTVPLLEFYRKSLKKIAADIVSRTDEYDSQNNKVQMLKLQFDNGKTLMINSVFIN